MMEKLMVRAQAAGRGAQRRLVEQIAARFREAAVNAAAGTDSILCSGRGLARRWLADPLLRFAARTGR